MILVYIYNKLSATALANSRVDKRPKARLAQLDFSDAFDCVSRGLFLKVSSKRRGVPFSCEPVLEWAD